MSAAQPPHPVLVAGGGVAALETVLALRALAGERVDVTLLAPERHFTYRPLAVGAPFGDGACVRYELAAVAAAVGATVVRDAVDAVEADAWRLQTQDVRTLGYDSLVLALGARADVAIPGALCFRGPRDVQRTATAIAGLRHAASPHVAFVVPTGSPWTLPMYELALLTGTWARREGL